MAKRKTKALRPKLKAKTGKATPKRQSTGKSKEKGKKRGNSTPSHLLPPRGLDFDPRKGLTPNANNAKVVKAMDKAMEKIRKAEAKAKAKKEKEAAKAKAKAEKEAAKAKAKAEKEAAKAYKGAKNLPPFVAINLRNQQKQK